MELVDPKYIIQTTPIQTRQTHQTLQNNKSGNSGVIFMVCFIGFIIFMYYIMKNVPANELQVTFEDTIPNQTLSPQFSPYNQDSTDINYATYS